ncbi:MAG: flagellar protein FlaG [Flavobacteriales bacterium]|jgi:flagellar protein FlaG
MNEVRFTQPAVPVTISAASSKETVEAKAQEGGKTLPTKATQNVDKVEKQAPPEPKEDLQTAVAEISTYVQKIQRDLQFTVDNELDRTVIKVVDSDSGDIIRQIPEDIFLELARRLKDDGEVKLMDAFG